MIAGVCNDLAITKTAMFFEPGYGSQVIEATSIEPRLSEAKGVIATFSLQRLIDCGKKLFHRFIRQRK